MKKHLNKKMVLGLALAAVLVIGATGTATWAYFSDRSESLTNEFTMGNITTEIVETFSQKDPSDYSLYTKNPAVKNIGEDDCYVRVRVLVTPVNALSVSYEGTETSLSIPVEGASGVDSINAAGWEYNPADGMFYYTKVLKAAVASDSGVIPGDTTTVLFDTVKVSDMKIDGFEVQVYQEAVQASMYAKDGSVTEDYKKIWAAYEANKIPESFN